MNFGESSIPSRTVLRNHAKLQDAGRRILIFPIGSAPAGQQERQAHHIVITCSKGRSFVIRYV